MLLSQWRIQAEFDSGIPVWAPKLQSPNSKTPKNKNPITKIVFLKNNNSFKKVQTISSDLVFNIDKMVALFKIQQVRFIEDKLSFKQASVGRFLSNLESLVRSKLKFSRTSPNTKFSALFVCPYTVEITTSSSCDSISDSICDAMNGIPK